MNLSSQKNKIGGLPQTQGVYLFRNKRGELLYIGKAVNLRSRVSSYFTGPHDSKTERMVAQIAKIDCQKTDSVLEALILEANLVKKNQPKYNIKLKDDKSFSYFVVTKEEFPRVLILRKTELELNQKSIRRLADKNQNDNLKLSAFYGPYISKRQMETALQIIRRIFPFHSLSQKTEKGCLDFQLGRCPGPYAGAIPAKDYLKNIRGIEMILAGRKNNLLKKLEKEMKERSSHQQFEKAAEIRDKIFALKHIQDIALISRDEKLEIGNWKLEIPRRIEAYDISNIFGQYATGSMIVFTDGRIDKSQYRKFKIKTIQGTNDVGMLKEVLRRRLKHKEWPLPNLIFIDGGIGQFNGAIKVLEEAGFKIPVCALAKGPTRRGEKLFASTPLIIKINLIKEIRDEAHRFAISYHRYLRKRGLMSGG